MLKLEPLKRQTIKGRTYVEGRYWNSGGMGMAIMAVITIGVDWTAYVGADNSRNEMDTCAYVCEQGSKLRVEDARYFFPDMELPYR